MSYRLTTGPAGLRALARTLDTLCLGRWWETLAPDDLLTPAQEAALGELWARGGADRATAEAVFVRHNQRLVLAQAQRFLGCGLPWDDLQQEGNLGLLRAVRRWDPTRTDAATGHRLKFSTYAVWWIRQGLTRAIADQSRLIRLPSHLHELRAALEQTTGALQAALGREPTPAELAAALGWSVAQLERFQAAWTLPESLDLGVGPEDATPRGTLLPDPAGGDPAGETAAWSRRAEVAALFAAAALTSRETYIITRRFGLDGHPPVTLDVVAQALGVTRERVRQVEADAFTKLRRAAAAGALGARWQELVA